MTGINYFMFNDEFEQETVRVQNDNPCAPDYIDSAWLGDEYFQTLQEENDEECNDDCELEDDKACAKNCKETRINRWRIREFRDASGRSRPRPEGFEVEAIEQESN